MKPKVLKLDPLNIDHELIKQAVEVIHNRGLVAFPTETVYGLGANALEPRAVAGIFEAKKRPLDDPLIVHIDDVKDLSRLSLSIPRDAHKLVDRFWPGPLTMILKKAEIVPDIVTTGLDTVAVRMPSGSIAREFIKAAGVPIAAPSANLFGRPSPTKAEHVIRDLDGRIDCLIDGGSTEIGVESTVVAFSGDRVLVLRPGGVSMEELVSVLGENKVELVSDDEVENSPGKYPQHYSPSAKVMVVPHGPSQREETAALARRMMEGGSSVGILCSQENEKSYGGFDIKVLGPANDGKACASRLFHILREFDEDKKDTIVVEAIPEKGLGHAVMNRLRKAAGPDLSV